MELSVIIVNWNTRELLAKCLESLALELEDFDPSTVEVFVVDNASTDGSQDMVCDSFDWVTLINNEENSGFSRANNQAIGISSGKCVLLLNSDTEMREGSLSAMTRYVAASSRIAAIGCRLVNPDGSVQCYPSRTMSPGAFMTMLWHLPGYSRLMRGAADAQIPCMVERIKGACMMLHRRAISDVGLLDERFRLYCEEDDWCLRALKRGWQLWYYPLAEVVHHGGSSTKQTRSESRAQLYVSRIKYLRKHYGDLSASLYRAAVYLTYRLIDLFQVKLRREARTSSKSYDDLLRAVREV